MLCCHVIFSLSQLHSPPSAADNALLSCGRPGLDSAELGGAPKLGQLSIILWSQSDMLITAADNNLNYGGNLAREKCNPTIKMLLVLDMRVAWVLSLGTFAWVRNILERKLVSRRRKGFQYTSWLPKCKIIAVWLAAWPVEEKIALQSGTCAERWFTTEPLQWDWKVSVSWRLKGSSVLKIWLFMLWT